MNLNELVEQVARHEISSSEDQKLLHNNFLDINKSRLLIDKDKVYDLVKKFLKRSLKDADREKHYFIVKSEFGDNIIKRLADFIDPEIGSSISMSSSITSILMDSLAVMNFNMVLKKNFSIDISPTIFFEYDTLEDFIEFLLKKYYLHIVTACLFPNFSQDRLSKELDTKECVTIKSPRNALQKDNSFIDDLEKIWSAFEENTIESASTFSENKNDDGIFLNPTLSLTGQSACPLTIPSNIDFSGYDHIPTEGGFIIAMNHTFWFDKYKCLGFLSELIQYKCHRKPYFLMAKMLKFQHALRKKMFNPLYLNRNNNEEDICLLLKAVDLLKQGEIVCLYPEGRQNRGKLVQAKTGVAYMASHADASILPVAVTGISNKKDGLYCRRQLIHVGKPIAWSCVNSSDVSMQHITDKVMSSVAQLLPEGQRGYYK